MRDIVGEKLGVSGRTAERAARVVDAIDPLTAHGFCGSAADLRETLNQNVTAAYQAAAPIYGETRAAHTQAAHEVTTQAVLQDDAQIEDRARELTKQKLAEIEAQKQQARIIAEKQAESESILSREIEVKPTIYQHTQAAANLLWGIPHSRRI